MVARLLWAIIKQVSFCSFLLFCHIEFEKLIPFFLISLLHRWCRSRIQSRCSVSRFRLRLVTGFVGERISAIAIVRTLLEAGELFLLLSRWFLTLKTCEFEASLLGLIRVLWLIRKAELLGFLFSDGLLRCSSVIRIEVK